MDHFNATVHNGALVSTRKGLLISKSKHQGTRFVNAFASEPVAAVASNSSSSKNQQQHNDSSTIPAAAAAGGESAETAAQHKSASSSSKWFDAAGMTTPSPAMTATTPTSMTSINNHARRTAEEPFTPMSNDDIGGVTASIHDEGHDPDSEVARALLYTGDQQPSAELSTNDAAAQTQLSTQTASIPRPTASQDIFASTHTEVDNPSQFLESVPALTQRVVSQYLNNVPQESHLYEAIAVVATLTTESESGGFGSLSPTELATSIARVCATMNKDFLLADDGGRVKLAAVLESIAAMAIDGMFAGQQRHWHVLMKTVGDIVDRSGGMKMDWGNTLNKIRKADIKGAVYAGTTPYLEFTKFFPSIPDSLPPQSQAEIVSKLQRCLQPANLLPVNMNSIKALAFFAQTVILARHALTAGSHVTIDPQGYAEDCLHVEYQLIKYPRALRADVAESDEAFAALEAGHEIESASLTKRTPNLLDALARVAAILYIEDLLPDVRSVDLYSILLTVLTHQLRNTILAIRHRGIDPQLNPTTSTPDIIADSLPSIESARPVLLWACLIGHAIANFVLQARPASIIDRSAFEDCVALLLVESSGLKSGDLELCEVLPIRELRAVSCDESTLLRQIVAGYEAKQVWNPTG